LDIDDIEAVTLAVLTASRLLVAISARSLSAVEETVTLPQFRLLVIISAHGPMKLVALAERLAVNPSTVLRMVDRLIAAELVRRDVNPRDRRETLVDLTENGHRTVAEVTARRREEIADVVRRMAPEQRTALIEAMRAFSAAGGETAAPVRDGDLTRLGWT
jgi:DNA-binding MarR family transcriptional regulator